MFRVLGLISLPVLGVAVGLAVRIWVAGHDLRRAHVAEEHHKPDQAIAAYRRHLSRFPKDGNARYALALLLKSGDPDLALREFRAIPADARELVPAARHVAALSLNLHRDYDARGPLLYLQERLPKNAGVELSLAEISFRERRFAEALQHAQRCRELRPNLPEAYLIAAESLDELQRRHEMIEPLEAVLKLDPQLPQAHLNLAYAYQLAGRTDEALEHIQWSLARDSRSAAAYRVLSLIERDRGRLDVALSAVQKSLRLEPHRLDSGLLEAELLLLVDRPEDAHRQLTELAEYHGDEQRLLLLRIRAAGASSRALEATELRSRLEKLTN